jgi:hypothetical protein
MPSSGICHHVTLVRTDISEKHTISIIRVKRISELGTLATEANCEEKNMLQLLVTVNVHSSVIIFTLKMEAIRSPEMSVLTTAMWHYISDDGVLLNLKSL